MGVFLRSTHIILGFSLTAWLLYVDIDLFMHHNYVESGLLLAVADMYSYFILVIIANRYLPWEKIAGPILSGEDEHPSLPAGYTSVTVDKS